MNAEAATDPTAPGKRKVLFSCPQCGAKGRKVGGLTMRSLLSANARKRFNESDSFLFCKTETCEVIYFEGQSGEQFREADIRVPVFQKSADPLRLVCYCFAQTVKAVVDDAVRTGTSTIADDITEKCRQGLDRCEETNPQGSCCLGNVRQVAKAALSQTVIGPTTQQAGAEEAEDCCCTPREP